MSALVYRLYDEAGALLYIGSTTDLDKRMAVHFNTRLSRVASIAGAAEVHARYHHHTLEPYDDVASARAAERAAIQSESPELNRAHNPSRWRWTGRSFTPASP